MIYHLSSPALDDDGTSTPGCDHGVTFDPMAARGMGAHQVRKQWPRGWFDADHPCPKGCGYRGIYYVSLAHYVAGDW